MGVRRRTSLAFLLTAAGIPIAAQCQHSADPQLGRGLSIEERSPWTFQASGLVSHFREPTCNSCSYRTAVPGIGLQREFRPTADTPLRFALSGGLQTDSFGEAGGYAAAVASLLWHGDTVTVRPGLGGFAFYRYMGEGGVREAAGREVVPAILPVISFEGVKSGLGATLLIAPNFSWAGRDRSGFVFLQLTYRLGGGRSSLALDGQPASLKQAQAAAADQEGMPIAR